MSVQAILFPVFILIALTLTLLGLTGRTRVGAIKRGQLRIKDIALGQNNWPDAPAKFGRAYQNQLELPVLFYLLVILAMMTRKADLPFVVMEWLFVVARLLHAAVHVTTNNVPRRFGFFVASYAILALMWGIFAVRILANL